LPQRKVEPEEWVQFTRRTLAKARHKALLTAMRHLRLGLFHPGRRKLTTDGKPNSKWYEDPMPKDAREACKYAELRAKAIDQVLEFVGGGRKQSGAQPLKSKSPSLDELSKMTDDERDEALRDLVIDGTYSRPQAERILKAARAQAEQMKDFEVNPDGLATGSGTDTTAEEPEDPGSQ
jgi:hypothetical protein